MPDTIAAPALVPSRFAPAFSMVNAAALSRMPPDALTPIVGDTFARISLICASVAPPPPKPVDVFT